MIHTQIAGKYKSIIQAIRLKTPARAVIECMPGKPSIDLTIILAGDEVLRRYNRDYIGIDAATDVLSFPADELDPQTGRRYKGDILISFDRAQDQAATGGQPVTAEIELLVVHGTLHLFGYDHVDADQKRTMWTIQADILKKLHNPLWDRV